MPTFVLASASIGDNLGTALSSTKLWTNIAATIIFIVLGFFFTKKKLLPENTGKVLTKFVMTVCLPCLAFCSFMSDFTVKGAIDAVVNFILGFVFYILFIFLSQLLFIWVKDKKKRTVLCVLFAFGSTTFFGYPLVSALYGSGAGNNFNIMNVAYRVFLYSYAYVAIANLKEDPVAEAGSVSSEDSSKKKTDFKSLMKKVFLNPIVIATFAGLILWLLQAIPGTAVLPNNWVDKSIAANKVVYVAPWRLDVLLPWIFSAAKTLGSLSSTIILFAIGCTLGGTNLKEAFTDKYAWIWAGLKVIVAPSIVLLILFALQAIGNAAGWLVLDGSTVSSLVSMNTVNSSIITWMVPPATVAVGYCINFDQEKEMASHISLIGTFCSVIGIVIWVILLTIISSTGFFAAAH